MSDTSKTVLDFFAGIGLVRYALERQGWTEIFALDYSPMKEAMYTHHFGPGHYRIEDVHTIDVRHIPSALLAHASFPCTDTSLAGRREGLAGPESSAFWGFIHILDTLGDRRPPLVLLENVEGFLTSNKGNDIEEALGALNNLGYQLDLMRIDAAHFVPQSRARLFIIGSQAMTPHNILEQDMILNQYTEARPQKIVAFIRAKPHIQWHLLSLPPLPRRTLLLEDIIDKEESWWDAPRTDYLFHQLHQRHKERIKCFMQQKQWSYGTAFRRMRVRDGIKQSTAEIRFDGIAGCLRTPKGGSARQILIRGGFNMFQARLLNAHENARLMGADAYRLAPDLSLNDALFGFGDAVCVPVIEWIAQHALQPLSVQMTQTVSS